MSYLINLVVSNDQLFLALVYFGTGGDFVYLIKPGHHMLQLYSQEFDF